MGSNAATAPAIINLDDFMSFPLLLDVSTMKRGKRRANAGAHPDVNCSTEPAGRWAGCNIALKEVPGAAQIFCCVRRRLSV
jgi:hypothetical protein